MIGKTISHYKILEKLGEGGMGVVYKAEDTKLERFVALKFLPHHLSQSEEEKQRFIHEAKAASALDHPNICTIYEIDETDDGQMFIAMACYEGESVKDKIERGPLPIGEALDIAIQVAHGLAKAHSKKIVHRDIKPANILITEEETVKIVDFGLAKLGGQSMLTKEGTTLGTVAYMSPEQTQGTEVDHRTDVWALGAVLYEMITGQNPFKGDYEQAVMYSIMNEEPEPMTSLRTGVPMELERIVTKAMAKSPDERYQHVDEMRVDLKSLAKQFEPGMTKQSLAKTKRPARKRQSTTPAPDERKISQAPSAVGPAKKKKWLNVGAVLVLAMIATVLILLREGPTEVNPNATYRILPISFTDIGYPGLSQDGNWVAFPAVAANGKWYVYLMNSSGGEPRRITSSDSSFVGIIESTDISPDGSQIVYCAFNNKTRKHEIHIVSSLGGLSKRIGEGGELPRWQQDGQRIGYILSAYDSKSGKKEFWSVKPDGDDNRLEFVDSVGTKDYEYSFSWSPDGQSVAWVRTFSEAYQEVIVRKLTTGNERQLTFDKKSIGEVYWMRGNEIIFSSNKSGSLNLWMVPAAGGQALQISKGIGNAGNAQVSADRKKLLYRQADRSSYLWISKSDGSGARQITFDERFYFLPFFSPDGGRLIFSMFDPGVYTTSQIYLMNRDGSDRQQLTFGSDLAWSAPWSPDGQWIAYSLSPGSIDSARTYLLAASNPATPKFIGRGYPRWWVNPETLIANTELDSWLFSIEGTPPQKFYEDSTRVYAVLEKYMLFRDSRKGREGLWLVPGAGLNAPATGAPKKILPEIGQVTIAPSGKFLLYYAADVGEVRKMSLPDGKEERFPVQLSQWGFNRGVGFSYDGKEIVYVDPHASTKLVIIENPFK